MTKLRLDRLRSADLRRDNPGEFVTAELDAPPPRPDQQLIFVYLGSATCGACQSPAVCGVVGQGLSRVHDAAVAIGLGFRSIGITIDQSPEKGLAHLSSLARFDEVSTGGSWLNLAANRFLWGDLSSEEPASVPQLLVMYRRIDHVKKQGGWSLRIGAETVLLRLRGANVLRLWASDSFAIPWDNEANLAQAG